MPDSFPTANRLRPFRRPAVLAAVMLEAMFAMAIIAVFISGMYATNARVWILLRSSLESNSASRTLNGRAEQLRAATWNQITTSTYLANTVFAVAPDAAGDTGGLVETIDVKAYPTPSPNPAPIRVTRNNTTGAVTTPLAGDGTMTAQTSVRIDITAAWTAKGGASRTRQMSMIITNGGITGRH